MYQWQSDYFYCILHGRMLHDQSVHGGASTRWNGEPGTVSGGLLTLSGALLRVGDVRPHRQWCHMQELLTVD